MRRRALREWVEALPSPLRGLGGLALLVLAAAALAVAAVAVTGVLGGRELEPDEVLEAAVEADPDTDPFAWSPGRRRDLERRAALGNAHPLYALSPGGVQASAKRTLRYEEEIAAAAGAAGVSAEMMEAMVLLESAGRPEVIAGGTDPANASGLAQIVAGTGIDLLGMEIDLARSRQLTATIAANLMRAGERRERATRLAGRERRLERNARKARRLRAQARELELKAEIARRQRLRIDPRFDPEQALEGMARYLSIATERFGREDLAVASYHMGIGNLESVIDAFVGPEAAALATRDLVGQQELSYAELFFASSPLEARAAWRVLAGFSDDSATYYWRVLAAREILRLWRDDREQLGLLDRLHRSKSTAEEVFHPEEETTSYQDADDLRRAIASGELVPFPSRREARGYGFEVGPQLGELTERLGVDRGLYRALRPEALATLIYIAGRVRAITGRERQTLTVTSAVRDQAYQNALIGRNSEATTSYSLHTTGFAFDILRDYASDRQARAFQFMLDRLRSLAVIDYAVEPQAIHITVSEEAEALLE